jgi:hypothetical protein
MFPHADGDVRPRFLPIMHISPTQMLKGLNLFFFIRDQICTRPANGSIQSLLLTQQLLEDAWSG